MGAAWPSLRRRTSSDWPAAFLFLSGPSNQTGAPWSLGGGTGWGSKILLSLILKELGLHGCKGHVTKHTSSLLPKSGGSVAFALLWTQPEGEGTVREEAPSLRAAERRQTFTSDKIH